VLAAEDLVGALVDHLEAVVQQGAAVVGDLGDFGGLEVHLVGGRGRRRPGVEGGGVGRQDAHVLQHHEDGGRAEAVVDVLDALAHQPAHQVLVGGVQGGQRRRDGLQLDGGAVQEPQQVLEGPRVHVADADRPLGRQRPQEHGAEHRRALRQDGAVPCKNTDTALAPGLSNYTIPVLDGPLCTV